MVRGLDRVRPHVEGSADHFVRIGGIAATLAMAEARLTLRATTDVEIVTGLRGAVARR